MKIRLLVLIVSALVLGISSAAQTSSTTNKATKKSTASSKTSKKRRTASRRQKRKKLTPAEKRSRALHARRARRAFVASSELKPMAQQLLDNRTPAAYAGVEAWARKHPASDAGSLAWFVVGYAHYMDREYDKAAEAFLKSRPHAGELADYSTYYLAGAYLNQGQSAPALELLKNFSTKYPDSLFVDDAALLNGKALTTLGDAQQAIAVLEPYADEDNPEIQLALGRAYLKAGNTQKAVEVLRQIYLKAPATPQAQDAFADLQTIPADQQPPLTVTERRARAEALMQAKQYPQAISEYRAVLADAPAFQQTLFSIDLAAALYRGGGRPEAKQLLEKLPNEADELSAKRNYYLVELARNDNDEGRMKELLGRMRESTPTSTWLQQSLLTAANMYLLRKDYDEAAKYYGEIAERFPTARVAPYAHWKAAWLTFRSGHADQAKTLFEDQIRLYPASNEIPPALYWRARLAEDDHDLPRARAYYQKITERFRNYYYADLAQRRLAEIGASGEVASEPMLARIPQSAMPKISDAEPPTDNPRVQKSLLLENGALYDFAVRELKAAAEDEDASGWVNREIARVYQAGGHYDLAVEVLKHAVPSYFALDMSSLPRPYWEGLFPRPYWQDLQRRSAENGLDPYLVASLIRQESEFNPTAVSHANAWGLMQVVPSTGSRLAHELRIGHFSSDQLLVPATNLQLGTRYFRNLVDKFGSVEYALAAYNAGPDRVQDWLSSGKFRDTAEFVESIPFTETREYVQAILRNANVYKRLYSTAEEAAATSNR